MDGRFGGEGVTAEEGKGAMGGSRAASGSKFWPADTPEDDER